VGLVKNRAGTAVKADLASVTAAARSALADIPADLKFSLTDAPGADAYPIAGTTWAIVYAKQTTAKGKALADFLRWATHEGQAFAEGLHYARLPAELVGRIDKKLEQLAGAQ
jgi:phosphate transport system substrate-binding protein